MGPVHPIQVLKKIDTVDIIPAPLIGNKWEIGSPERKKTFVSILPVDKSENTSAKEKRILKTISVQRRMRNWFLSILNIHSFFRQTLRVNCLLQTTILSTFQNIYVCLGYWIYFTESGKLFVVLVCCDDWLACGLGQTCLNLFQVNSWAAFWCNICAFHLTTPRHFTKAYEKWLANVNLCNFLYTLKLINPTVTFQNRQIQNENSTKYHSCRWGADW